MFLLSVPLELRHAFSCVMVLCFLAAPLHGQSVFPDKALENVVRQEVFAKRYNQEPITAEDVKNISQVVGKGKGIANLEGLQHCLALALIDLENNQIQDLTPMKELKQLQSINLAGNQIESVQPLEGLLQVQYLELSRNRVSDIQAIRPMTNMRTLYLSENRLKSLEALGDMSKLGTLYAANNPIEDWSVIGKLKWLHSLDLSHCKLRNLDFLKPLRQLHYLMLAHNELADVDALVSMCEAEKQDINRFAPFLQLYLDGNPVEKESAKLQTLKDFGVRVKSLTKPQ